MRVLTTVSAAAVLAFALMAAPEAMAQRGRNNNNQSTTVVVVNYQRVLTETALGRDLNTKLQGVRTQVQQEAQALQPEGQSIEQERQRLAGLSRNLTNDQIRASATLAPQFQAFQQRVQQFQARGQALEGDMQCSQAVALRDFDRQVSPIIQSVMTARGAGAVLDSSQVNFVSPDFDITTTVIQQVDQGANTRTANVARHAVSECQAPAAAAAPH
jgi:Skp family chaperone for outer membrane proteins